MGSILLCPAWQLISLGQEISLDLFLDPGSSPGSNVVCLP